MMKSVIQLFEVAVMGLCISFMTKTEDVSLQELAIRKALKRRDAVLDQAVEKSICQAVFFGRLRGAIYMKVGSLDYL